MILMGVDRRRGSYFREIEPTPGFLISGAAMANPEHLARLKEGVEAWNKWREKNPDIEIDLREASLGRLIKLRFANIRDARLEGANLRGAYLQGAVLYHADLEWAQLRRAHLQHADLNSACLKDADLGDAHLEHTTLLEARLEHADCGGADLQGADLRRANLQEAHLMWSNLRDANVSGVEYLYPASLRNLGYRRRIMRGHFQGIRGLDSSYGNRIFVRDAADQDYLDSCNTHLRIRRRVLSLSPFD